MAILSRPEFKRQFERALPYYAALGRTLTWLSTPDTDHAWGIYKRASRPSLGFNVMGRTVVDRMNKDGSRMQPSVFGNAIDLAEHKNFHMNSTSDNRNDFAGMGYEPGMIGSILCFYNGRTEGNVGWHFAYNDAWIIGGVHGGVEFQLASPRTRDNIWPSTESNMSVTARELIGLRISGYNIYKTFYNEVARCKNPATASRTSFMSYIAAYEKLKDDRAQTWRELCSI